MYVTENNFSYGYEKFRKILNKSVIGFDIETTSLYPTIGEIRLLQFSYQDGDRKDCLVFDCFKIDKKAIEQLISDFSSFLGTVVIHNAKFDLSWLYFKFKTIPQTIYDTYLVSVILSCTNPTPPSNSLKSCVERFLKIPLDKKEQVSDWSGELSLSQLAYAEKDSIILLDLYEAMEREVDKTPFRKAVEDENRAVLAIALLEATGFYLDEKAWDEVITSLDNKANEVMRDIMPVLFGKGGYLFPNLDSPSQIKQVLQDMGIDIKSTSFLQMKEMENAYPIVKQIMTYRHYNKLVTGFSKLALKYRNQATGRVYSSYNQIGARSGRITSKSPNLQQIPRDGGLRECFKAEEGNSLIIADYSQIELRVIASLSMDSSYIRMFNSGQDLHTATASIVLNKPVEVITKEERYFAKQLNFGLVYGIGPKSFAIRSGISVRKANAMMRSYFKSFPELTIFLRNSGRLALLSGFARACNNFSRPLYRGQDQTKREEARRIGTNMEVQGTAAVIMKRALASIAGYILNDNPSVKLVNNIHDEVILECPEVLAEEVKAKLEELMIKAGETEIKEIPVGVDAIISNCWRKG